MPKTENGIIVCFLFTSSKTKIEQFSIFLYTVLKIDNNAHLSLRNLGDAVLLENGRNLETESLKVNESGTIR